MKIPVQRRVQRLARKQVSHYRREEGGIVLKQLRQVATAQRLKENKSTERQGYFDIACSYCKQSQKRK